MLPPKKEPFNNDHDACTAEQFLVSIQDIKKAGCSINRSWFLKYCKPEKATIRHFGMENLYSVSKILQVAKKRREEVIRNTNLANGRKAEALKNIDLVEKTMNSLLKSRRSCIA